MTQTNDEDKESFAVVGFNAGYSKHVEAGLQFGYRFKNIYVSINQYIPVTSSSLAPKKHNASVGYNIGSFQAHLSYGYHFIGKVTEQYFRGTKDEYISGCKFGYGLSFYTVKYPINLTLQRTGKEFIASLTLYKTL